MNEIGISDVKETNTHIENYKDIKPEKEMPVKELNNAVKEEYDKAVAEAKEYFDDEGNKFREEDNLIPDNEFQVNGYDYKTDDEGRIISAEGKLKLRDSDYERNMENVRHKERQEYKDTDHRGHLIGHQFGGSDRLENLVPMDAGLNQGDYEKIESTLANAVKDGADVRLKVEPRYEGESTRPSEFRMTYSIDGERDVVVFRNESEAMA